MQTLGVPGLSVTAFDGGRIITQLRSSTQAIELSEPTPDEVPTREIQGGQRQQNIRSSRAPGVASSCS
jgi:hypothetical protein